MEQKQDFCLLDQSLKYPWLVLENLKAEDDKGDQIFYPIHDPLSQYQFRIPGGRIQGCFHGWVILSNNLIWSIWNPSTCNVIRLPPLILKDVDSESIGECCLSCSPDDPRSLVLLTIHKKPIIVFCRVDGKLGWTEMSYARQMRDMELFDTLLYCLTCCNGTIYALITMYHLVMHVDVDVSEDGQVVINLLPFVDLPPLLFNCYDFSLKPFLKGTCVDQLFYISMAFDKLTLSRVYLYKLDMTSLKWEELQDLKDAIFFFDLAHEQCSVYYRSQIASELGGYIHILGQNGKAMHSLHVKDKIVSVSSCLMSSSSRLLLWECTRLPLDHGDIKCRTDFKPVEGSNRDIIMLDINSTENEENKESYLLNIPFNVLEMIIELCAGVEYLNFRATCKTCQLGAPITQWSKGTALSKLQTPWLVVINHHQGLVTFTDPMFGDNYFINTPRELNGDTRIVCSRYGWLLMTVINEITNPRLMFFNPFTHDIRELPGLFVSMFCFSAPPTSPNCIVVGFDKFSKNVYIHFVAGEPYWRTLFIGANPHYLRFPTFHGSGLYAMCKDGGLVIIRERETEDVRDYSWERVTTKAPTSLGKALLYFLVKGDEHLLLVKMGKFGEDIQVFKLNDSTKNWEKIDGLGRHMIFICDTTCIYIEAKTQEMENKIYFPRLHSENQKMVFYSLETRTYHTSDGKSMEQNFFGTQHHTYSYTWIQPSWS